VVPHIVVQSPRPRLGEFETHAAKRLLQHYRHKTDMPTVFRDVRFQGQSGKHLLALLLELMTSVHWVKADIAVASVEI
jgi:hypothetical protein